MNMEIQLYTFFASAGESIHYIADAVTGQGTFLPQPNFHVKFALKESGVSTGLAWYNAGSPNTLHELVPTSATAGTEVSADILNDPNYEGGAIGFALLRGVGKSSYYSEQMWNIVCTSCNPTAPWIASLTYASKKLSNAFYLAFEDYGLNATSFNNDGDFNDAVFLLTGVTCP